MSDEDNMEFCSCEFPKQVLFVVTSVSEANGHRTGVWLEEFAQPYRALTDAGYEITVASPLGEKAPIDPASENLINDVKWKKEREVLNNTVRLDAVDYVVFDALVLPGGHGPMFDLAQNETLGEIVNYFSSKHRLIAAICHGPAGLLPAQNDSGAFVKGRRLTCFTNEEEKNAKKQELVPFYLEDALKTADAIFVQQDADTVNVVEDDNLITAQNAQSSKAFADAIVKYLSENN